MSDYDIGTARGVIELDASSLGRASAALTTVGLGMVAFGAAAVGAFVYIAKEAAQFEHTMSAVQAVTNATEAEMESLRQVALDLGSSTVYSADEIAHAFEDLGKAGIPVEDILNGAAEATVTFAAAAGDELAGGVARAAEVVANAMKTFGASSDEIEHFTDVMVAAAASSTLSVDDIATSLTYVGAVANTAGVSFDELNTMLAILGDRGIKGSTAGTSLRGVLLSLTPTSDKATNALKELGLITADGTNKFFDMNGTMKSIPEVMQLLQEATAGLSEEQKISTFNTIFQRRAMASALILAEAGAEGFDAYAAAMAGLTASDIAATKIDNLSGDMTILKNSINALIIEVGLPLQDMIRGWVGALQSLVDKLREVNPEILAWVVMGTAVAGTIVGLIGAFLVFAGIMLKLWKIWIDLKAAMLILWPIISGVGSSIVAAIGAPVLIVIAIITALIAIFTVLYFKVDAVRNFIDGLWDSFQDGLDIIREFIGNAVQWFKDLWAAFQEGGVAGDQVREVLNRIGGAGDKAHQVFAILKDAALQVWAAMQTAFGWIMDNVVPILVAVGMRIGEFATDIYNWFMNWVMPVFTAFNELVLAVMARVSEAFNLAWPIIQDVFFKIVDVITWAWGVAQPLIEFWMNFMVSTMTTAFNIAKDIVSTALDIILNFWNTFKDNVWPLIVIIWNFIYAVIEAVFNTIKAVVEGALQVIRGIINVVTGIISGDWSKVWEGIKNIFGGIWHGIVGIVSAAMAFLQNILSIGWEAIKWVVGTALEAIRFSIETVMAVIQLIWDTVWNAIKWAVENAWNLIVAVVTTNLAIVQAIISAVMGFIMAIVQGAWTAVKWVFTEGIGAVVGFMRDLPGKIVSALGSLINLLMGKGREIIDGLFNGIKFVWDLVNNFLRGIPDKILGVFSGAASWLFNIGKDIIQGLLDGIESMINTVKDKLGGITDLIPDWKGPPEKDAKLLTNNGKLIMQSLVDGLESGYGDVQKMLSKVAPTIQSQVGISGALGTGSGGGSATVVFDFSGSTFGDGAADEVKGVVTSQDTLKNLSMAIKAGSRK